MVYVTIGSLLIALFFLTRFLLLKKEIRSATKRLKERHQDKTDQKISLGFYDKDFEKLAEEINVQIDETRQAVAQKRRTENELKQAISNISHDIRTPMTSILGYIQFLESEDIPYEKRKEYVTTVKKGALRLKVLLEDFFELSVIESADYSLKLETISLNEIVLEVVVGFYDEFNHRKMEPKLVNSDGPFKVMGNPSATKRVIENLLSNAIKHSTGDVTIALNRTGAFVELIVSNPAPQLKAENLSSIFDRFYKGDQSRREKGTGLGLSIAKSLMEKMNGSLTAELRNNQLYMKCRWIHQEKGYQNR
ncbi:HAMP domain-containing histidine kinase [Robertmurraya yapensis]|uniref:histidine kinase n=1 Tax=Bacillus yapensis TaxID=2492960 RepID=A0A3S0IDL6_9BACI|nr:HAMP domain-containing sensor histidine kinase [Bacillus yapensis]RTR33115.1 HAMP domain-containing histidine kinase [Bacillus yapensis]TKS96938.1 HAMP domain-containing histidine kinase [Bacillus yapensis]